MAEIVAKKVSALFDVMNNKLCNKLKDVYKCCTQSETSLSADNALIQQNSPTLSIMIDKQEQNIKIQPKNKHAQNKINNWPFD